MKNINITPAEDYMSFTLSFDEVHKDKEVNIEMTMELTRKDGLPRCRAIAKASKLQCKNHANKEQNMACGVKGHAEWVKETYYSLTEEALKDLRKVWKSANHLDKVAIERFIKFPHEAGLMVWLSQKEKAVQKQSIDVDKTFKALEEKGKVMAAYIKKDAENEGKEPKDPMFVDYLTDMSEVWGFNPPESNTFGALLKSTKEFYKALLSTGEVPVVECKRCSVTQHCKAHRLHKVHCKSCNGRGRIGSDRMMNGELVLSNYKCYACNGKGHTVLSDARRNMRRA